MVCNNHECRTNGLKMVNLAATVATLQTEARQKNETISVLVRTLDKYAAAFGDLPGYEPHESYAPPSLLLDKQPANGLRTHTSTENEEIPPCPGTLLGAPIVK